MLAEETTTLSLRLSSQGAVTECEDAKRLFLLPQRLFSPHNPLRRRARGRQRPRRISHGQQDSCAMLGMSSLGPVPRNTPEIARSLPPAARPPAWLSAHPSPRAPSQTTDGRTDAVGARRPPFPTSPGDPLWVLRPHNPAAHPASPPPPLTLLQSVHQPDRPHVGHPPTAGHASRRAGRAFPRPGR